MTSSDFPNKDRAEDALIIYRDAMRQYISLILRQEYGPDWIRSQVLNDDLHERNPGRYERGLQALTRDTLPHDLIDLADVPRLIQNNRHSFDDLRRADIDRMHWIRGLRNELHHADPAGDCTPSYADAVVGLCGLVLEQCGLTDAVERIRRLSSAEPASGGETPSTALREERQSHHRGRRSQDLAATEPSYGGALAEARAGRALLIYRAAMRRYVSSILQQEYGDDWLRQALEGEMRGHYPRSARARLLASLNRGEDPEHLVDIHDASFIVQSNQQLFPDLQPVDIERMHSIILWRAALAHHELRPGPADEILDACSLVLKRFGLFDEAERIRRL